MFTIDLSEGSMLTIDFEVIFDSYRFLDSNKLEIR